MIPLMAIAIPIYFVYGKLNLIDTYTGIILIHTFINLPLAVLLLKSFFDEIPKQIDESALIDGASRIKIIHKIIIPSTTNGLTVTFILSFIFSWTEFICALMIGQMNIKTIPVQASILKTIPSWDYMAAFTTVSIIPIFVLILLIKNHFVRGLTLGSIKE
jgi:multiple sugar transport system permease protein